jgi:tripartite-type tricarboxylate transporter receptor subunit TctC
MDIVTTGPARRQLLVAALAAACGTPALAQGTWPTKTVRIVHGFTPGGPVDALARLIAGTLIA